MPTGRTATCVARTTTRVLRPLEWCKQHTCRLIDSLPSGDRYRDPQQCTTRPMAPSGTSRRTRCSSRPGRVSVMTFPSGRPGRLATGDELKPVPADSAVSAVSGFADAGGACLGNGVLHRAFTAPVCAVKRRPSCVACRRRRVPFPPPPDRPASRRAAPSSIRYRGQRRRGGEIP